MITLKTLVQATAQQVFDQVATHLLKQMEPAEDPVTGACLYRYGDLKCAAGCLISDEEYIPEMMGSWKCLVESGLAPITRHNHLITELQVLHDRDDPAIWADLLRTMAHKHGLKMPAIGAPAAPATIIHVP